MSKIQSKEKKKMQSSRKIAGRPKGSKSGLPFTTFPEAIEYAKSIWQKAEYREISFGEISKFMKLHEKKAARVLNTLRDFYGIVEKSDTGSWRLTETGKRVAKHDATGLKESFSKDAMFADLMSTYGNKEVTEGVIQDYIKKRYKGVDSEEVKNRFIDAKKIIDGGHPTTTSSHISGKTVTGDTFSLSLLRLKYILDPPTNEQISELVSHLAKTLKESNDDTLQLLAELMEEKKHDKKELANLVDKAMKRLKIEMPEKEKKSKSGNGNSEE